MPIIYKLTREDGLEYIGVTVNLVKRLNKHKHSRRFEEFPIKSYEILYEGSYEDCDRLEETYIEKYDTFKHGLNMTERGKGKNKSNKFNTYGYKFSEESRKKMSEKGRARTHYARGHRHSEETKKKWSELRKGKIWGTVKAPKEEVLKAWEVYNPPFEYLRDILCLIERADGWYYPTGYKFEYDAGKSRAFLIEKGKQYNVTKEAIRRILKLGVINELSI